MQIKLFTIPIIGVSDYNEELNVFLRSNKIIEIEKELVQSTTGAYWCIYISYLEHTHVEKASKEKIDYMKELEPAVFALVLVIGRAGWMVTSKIASIFFNPK